MEATTINPAAYRLRSHVDESLNLGFECMEDMIAHVETHNVSTDDATMEEWIDDRITPANSTYREVSTFQRLLTAAAEAQTAFWNAVRDLETETGLDLDSAQDFSNVTTIDDLMEEE